MPFREKSAWIMAVILTVVGAAYFYVVAGIGSETGQLAGPMPPLVIVYTACLIGLAIVGHVVIAIFAPRDANAGVDERERHIFERAGHYSSYILGAGVIMSLGYYLLTRNGDLLFYTVFASLMLGQVMEYVLQIVFYRSAV